MNALAYPQSLKGKLLPGRALLAHRPSAGIGEYYPEPNAPLAGLGSYVAYPVRGLGQTGAMAVGLGTLLLGGIILGAAGWYAGKAMAPTRASEGTYKLAGALSNVLLPGIGLGVVGGFALAGRQSQGG